jgi:hypothetical protein
VVVCKRIVVGGIDTCSTIMHILLTRRIVEHVSM